MIEELHIRDLGVIEDTSLLLGPGLTVITGETGAGKTMLVTALQLLLGARASTDLVRRGAKAAVVEAVVRVPTGRETDGGQAGAGEDPALTDDGEALWSLAEDGVLIVSREVPVSGRSRARVGGRLVPSALLAELLGPHIEVHGQHEHVRLERPAVQRQLLDGYGGTEHHRILARYRAAHATWTDATRRERLLREDASARTDRLARLRAERDEIDAVALDPDRDATLDRDIERLANAEALRAAVETAREAAGTPGALDALGTAIAALRRAPVEDPAVRQLADRLSTIGRELSEIVADLATLADDITADDVRLDALQSRKRDVTVLLRRYGATVEDVLAHRAAVAEAAADLEALAADAEGVEFAVAAAHADVIDTAAALTASRRRVGERLCAAAAEHLAELGLEHSVLSLDLAPVPPGPDGADRVELLLAANPGESASRLADAASGGERSRVSLALEVVLAGDRAGGVLVFDEVDAGVGGSTALAVGQKLARLAGGADGADQVLCVTHLAQVAAFADAHHEVEKHVRDGRTVTTVEQVAEPERAAVLSRMLGGEATADAGIDHARRLLEAARARRGT